VLEIGSTFREARIRRGVELAEVEAETHIRTRYLEALENDRFEVVPGEAYVRGFLRTYADYLGLEADLFVDEYNARFAPPKEPLPELTRGRIEPRRLPTRGTVGALLAVGVVVVLAWRFGAGDEPTLPQPSGEPGARKPPATPARSPVRPRRNAGPATLVLAAARGPCWLSVHVGSRTGRRLHEGLLEDGGSLRFAGTRLWIRLGAPRNLQASVNGKRVRLPDDTANVVVTRDGMRSVEVG